MTWKILLDCGIKELPVDLSKICNHFGVRVLSYGRGHTLLAKMGKLREAKRSDGFIIRPDDAPPIIFYNGMCSVGRQRFTIAHELGHLLLDHKGDLINREPSPGDNPVEREANIFAARLLAPSCVLWGVDTCNPSTISQLCNISYQAANFQARRMVELLARDRKYMQQYGHPYFLQSQVEEQLYRQFLPYIKTHKAPLFGVSYEEA